METARAAAAIVYFILMLLSFETGEEIEMMVRSCRKLR